MGGYSYTVEANTSYVYEFEAWTKSGTRAMEVEYFDSSWDELGNSGRKIFDIDTTNQTYTFIGPAISIAGVRGISFHCADQLGTFYVKMLSITKHEVGKSGDFSYTEGSSSVTITGYTGNGGAVEIPSTINGKPVVAIGDWAFEEKQLTSVVIPASVTTIGNSAFRNNDLTSLTIPNSVTSIGDFAFYYNELTSVDIGNSVTSIGVEAFYSNQLTSVTIPDSVTSIGEMAFGMNYLTSVTIGADVQLDEYGSFPGDFGSVYDNSGKQAGTYTCPTAGDDSVWTKQ